MRIDLNRLSVLAGLPTNGSNLTEGAMHDQNEMRAKMAEKEETEEGMRNKMSEKDLEEMMNGNESMVMDDGMRNKMAEEEETEETTEEEVTMSRRWRRG